MELPPIKSILIAVPGRLDIPASAMIIMDNARVRRILEFIMAVD
jgi:hypothetical protein